MLSFSYIEIEIENEIKEIEFYIIKYIKDLKFQD